MKLVIELDKVAYDLLTGKIETANIDLFSTLIQSVQNGTPLEEELEKIKAEIQGLCHTERDTFDKVVRLDKLNNAIDTRIKELKGENNE